MCLYYKENSTNMFLGNVYVSSLGANTWSYTLSLAIVYPLRAIIITIDRNPRKAENKR